MTTARAIFVPVLLGLLLGGGSIVLTTLPASASDTEGCVSRAEYRLVSERVRGLPRTEAMVIDFFDTRGGLEIKNPGRKLMYYRSCWASNRYVWVGYRWNPSRGWVFEYKSLSL